MLMLDHCCRTVEVNTHAVLLEEGGVNLRLTVIDTPGKEDFEAKILSPIPGRCHFKNRCVKDAEKAVLYNFVFQLC